MKRKAFEELTIKDNFMFTAVMMDEINCKGLLERALDMEIDHVVINKEHTIIYNPDFKSVRLDIYAANGTDIYDVKCRLKMMGIWQNILDTIMMKWICQFYQRRWSMKNFIIVM